MEQESIYEVGQLVEHRRYGYRGVVVASTPECEAPESWYRRNRTQPDRGQPWYHVLVHGGDHTTYVAEENLREDFGCEQVVHPLTRVFFRHFHRGRYTPRDDVRFPSFPG